MNTDFHGCFLEPRKSRKARKKDFGEMLSRISCISRLKIFFVLSGHHVDLFRKDIALRTNTCFDGCFLEPRKSRKARKKDFGEMLSRISRLNIFSGLSMDIIGFAAGVWCKEVQG